MVDSLEPAPGMIGIASSGPDTSNFPSDQLNSLKRIDFDAKNSIPLTVRGTQAVTSTSAHQSDDPWPVHSRLRLSTSHLSGFFFEVDGVRLVFRSHVSSLDRCEMPLARQWLNL